MSIFNSVRPNRRLRRSVFNLSHQNLLTCDIGQLIPFLCEEIVPGDRWRCNASIFTRLQPLIAPVIGGSLQCTIHYWFVPKRLIWEDFEDFITGGESGMDAPVIPYTSAAGGSPIVRARTIGDYMGIPMFTQASGNLQFCTLPFRAYALIYNWFYRDENLVDEINIPMSSGQDQIGSWYPNVADFSPLNVAYKKDYFTSALPFTQRGTEVNIPVFSSGQSVVSFASTPAGKNSNINVTSSAGSLSFFAPMIASEGNSVDGDLVISPNEDLGNMSVNDLRRSVALQELFEQMARCGARYPEYLRGVFGVTPRDARLQMPQYLGGGVQDVVISEILQTSESTQNSPQGNMSGHGAMFGARNGFQHYFDEDGYVIGVLFFRPRTAYYQGIRKMWTKTDRFDFFNPYLQNLGEQPILKKELYVSGTATDEEIFGYTPRYAEYKFIPSSCHGDFRDSLDFWHWYRKFSASPSLGQDFIEVDSQDFARNFAVSEVDWVNHLLCRIDLNIKASRPMSRYGTPKLL